MKEFLEIGKITGTHGIKGEVRLQPWCSGADFIKQFKTLYLDEKGLSGIELLSVRPHKGMAILRLSGVNDMNAAQAMRGRVLYCRRSDARLEPQQNFIADIIGCRVVNAEGGAEYGVVRDVLNYGASDILEVELDGKKEYVPLIDEVVKKIDCDSLLVEIIPMKGLFDED